MSIVRHESQEDYLEAILMIKEKEGVVRSIDVANLLGFSRPSVHNAVKKLKEEGYVDVNEHGELTLTDIGFEIARKTLDKHIFLTEFFKKIGEEPSVAEDVACQIEHSIPEETFHKLREYLKDK